MLLLLVDPARRPASGESSEDDRGKGGTAGVDDPPDCAGRTRGDAVDGDCDRDSPTDDRKPAKDWSDWFAGRLDCDLHGDNRSRLMCLGKDSSSSRAVAADLSVR